jgi:hypothetical protein
MENASAPPDTRVVTDLLQIFFVCVRTSSRHYLVLELIKFLSYGEMYEFDIQKTESIKLIAFHSNTYFLSKPFRIPLLLFVRTNLYHLVVLSFSLDFRKENQRPSALRTSHFSHS